MKILIIGAGKMGEAVLRVWLSDNSKFKKMISVVEVNSKKRNMLKKNYPSAKFSEYIPDKWKGDLILFAIKPQTFSNIAKVINSKNISTKIILSIMAGITLSSLEKLIHGKAVFFRAMPNLASSVGSGVTGVFARKPIISSYKKKIEQLLTTLGWVYWLKSEKLFDPLTAISGSGPAYIFLFLKIMKNSSKNLGFSEKISNQLVLKTIKGVSEILKKNSNLEELISDVASPGGTTEAALEVLIKGKPNLKVILNKAILAANKRSIKLGKNAKKL